MLLLVLLFVRGVEEGGDACVTMYRCICMYNYYLLDYIFMVDYHYLHGRTTNIFIVDYYYLHGRLLYFSFRLL